MLGLMSNNKKLKNIADLRKNLRSLQAMSSGLILDIKKIKGLNELKSRKQLELAGVAFRMSVLERHIYLHDHYPALLKPKKNSREIVGFDNWPLTTAYGSIVIDNPFDAGWAVIRYNTKDIKDAFQCVDILSFFYNKHFFINEDFSKEELEMYDFIIMSQEDGSEIECFKEIFKTKIHEFSVIPKSNYPELFGLYNSALRQVDVFAKCIFLFRIIEFYHCNILKSKGTREKAFNKLLLKVDDHKFTPIWIADYKNKKYYNLINNKKVEFKKILSYLKKDENPYNFVYQISRCGVAHGGDKKRIIYHSKENIDKIRKANIVLMLLSRLIIEENEVNIINEVNLVRPKFKY